VVSDVYDFDDEDQQVDANRYSNCLDDQDHTVENLDVDYKEHDSLDPEEKMFREYQKLE
jgi:hypothetical protein